jgi:hypothetical protein
MNTLAESQGPALVLRLVLDERVSASDLEALDWVLLLEMAERNDVLVRLANRLTETGVQQPEFFTEAVARERRRVRAALELVHTVSGLCRANGIEFVFPKATQHLPDMGNDLDLLLLSRSLELDRRIVEGLAASAKKRDFNHRITGSTVYTFAGCPPLDIQHGRLGAVGEHVGFPRELVRNRRHVIIDGAESFTASPNDRLVLQGLQRVYGRLRIQLCDIIYTIGSIRRDDLDWDYIVTTARRHGVLAGLSCYLSYVEQIFRWLYGQDLLSAAPRSALRLQGWGRVRFRGYQYRYPTLRVNGGLYGRQLGFQVAAGNWEGAGRICLIPVVAAARAVRRLTRRGNREDVH